MAKGYQRHQERLQQLHSFGRFLARRSGSRCELCEASGVPLAPFELPPYHDDPDPERCLFLCETCRHELTLPRRANPYHWRVLEATAWSGVPAVQAAAVAVLRHLAGEQGWSADLLDQLYLSEEVDALLATLPPLKEW
jgi:protein PhnA